MSEERETHWVREVSGHPTETGGLRDTSSDRLRSSETCRARGACGVTSGVETEGTGVVRRVGKDCRPGPVGVGVQGRTPRSEKRGEN